MSIWSMVHKVAPISGGQGQTPPQKKKYQANHSKFVGVRYNKQGNVTMRLVSSDCKISRCLTPPSRILKVYVEALPRVGRGYCPDGLHYTLLFWGCILENGSGCGSSGQNVRSKGRGRGWRTFDCPGPASESESISGHVLLWLSPTMFSSTIIGKCFME